MEDNKSLNEDDPCDHQSLGGQVQKMKNDILGLNYPEDIEVKDPLPQIELKAVTRRKVKTKRRTSANRSTVEQSTDTDAAERDFVDNQNDEDEEEVKKDPLPQMEQDAVKRNTVKLHLECTSEKGLLTRSIVGSMLEDVDMVRTDGHEIHRPSSSKSSLSITSAMTRGSQSDFTNSLPGTPVPNEWPVESYCPIIRSSVIDMSDSSTHSQGSTNYTRQTISAIVDTVMEVIPREDTEHIATADDVTSFTRRLARLSPRDSLQNFSHELTDKVYELIKSHNTPQALFVRAGKSVSDSILLKLKTGLNASEESREFPSDLVYSFAEESIKRLLQQIVFWLPPPSQGSDFCQTIVSDGSLQDTSRLIPSSSAISISSSPVYCDTKSLFTNIMVNQVMDTCSVASNSSEELSELMNIINGLSPTDAGTLDSDRPAPLTPSRQSSAKSLPRPSLSGSSTHNGGTVDIQVLGEMESKMDNKDMEMSSVSVIHQLHQPWTLIHMHHLTPLAMTTPLWYFY
ncbi:uncharacterized protein LOC129849782 [Salvelinus fontinalis]|uniref:uncharacterized protein LOC129849782 n=1 Tax=Salvelinus fontinalis TaxID=8038 RepID=UPI0024865630|nr:uncharacterized protein LOC129849782 [Salvelinus fontinalis]